MVTATGLPEQDFSRIIVMYYFSVQSNSLHKPTQCKFDRKFPSTDKPLGSPVSLDFSSALLVLSVNNIYKKLISTYLAFNQFIHVEERIGACIVKVTWKGMSRKWKFEHVEATGLLPHRKRLEATTLLGHEFS